MEDIFDSSLNLEDTHFREGYDEGFTHGIVAGKEEGKDVGLKLGFEIGEELGFYRGCVDVWNSAIRIDPTRFSSRVQKIIKQMEELVDKYPVMDPENEAVQEIMDGLRLKFKMVLRRRMLKYMLACCKVYISESRNRTALDSIERAAKLYPEAAIINKFEDETYNRVGYTLVSKLGSEPSDSCALKSAVFAMVKAAFETISLELHHGSHPRLGVVDHICFHPLAHASLEQTAGIAKSLALDIGSCLQVPTFLYGAANEEGQTLDSIRRELGYFKPNSSGNQWAGPAQSESSLPLTPHKGPALATQATGVVVIGASRWVDNYNVPIYSTDMAAVRRIAKRVSGRGGGLQSVQAMALVHGDDVIEVACNLLEPSRVGGDHVQLEVERLAKEEGIDVGKGYFTDLPQEKIIESYLKLGS